MAGAEYSRAASLLVEEVRTLLASRVYPMGIKSGGPVQGREAVLQELHEGHPGMTKMKALARMYVWWPGMEKDIETTVRTCAECQSVHATPPVAPLHLWRWPTRPWARLHLDYAGPFSGKMFLVLIDAHSKWIVAIYTPSATMQ